MNQLSLETGFRERLAYSFTGMALTIATQFVAFFQLYFLTDVFLLPPLVISALLLGFRLFDAIDDQVLAFLIGCYAAKKGGYRRIFRLFALPFAAATALMFFTPNIPLPGKIAYVICIYLVWEIISTIVDIAIGASLPFMTRTEDERIAITSMRILFSIVAILVILVLTQPLIKFFGQWRLFGSTGEQTGYFLTVACFALLIVPLLLFAAGNVKERHFQPSLHHPRILPTLKLLLKNRALVALVLMFLTFEMAVAFKNSMAAFFVSYSLGKPTFVTGFIFIGIGASFLMQFVIPKVGKLMSKELVVIIGLVGSAVSMTAMYFFQTSFWVLVLLNITFGIFSAFPANLVYSLVSRYVDTSMRDLGVNISTQLYALIIFAFKLSAGCAGAVCPVVMACTGYVANTTQSAFSIQGINLLYVGATAFWLLISIGFGYWYYRSVQIPREPLVGAGLF